MLAFDDFRRHLTECVKKLEDERMQLVVMPVGMTSQLQPLDICLNEPFNTNVRQLYNKWMATHCPNAVGTFEADVPVHASPVGG